MTTFARPTGTATERMTRVLFIGAALTGIAFASLSFRHTLNQFSVMNPVWHTTVIAALWTLPLLITVLAWWAPLRLLRAAAIAFVAIYCAALVTWPFAQETHRIPDGVQPWIIDLLPMTVFTAAIVLPEIAAAGFLVIACFAAGILRYVADGSQNVELSIQDTLFNTTTILVFVAIVIVTLRAGRQRDATADRTAADAVVAAATEAQDSERAMVAALTHDDVISTLLAAARATDATAPLASAAAERALQRLDELSTAEPESGGSEPAAQLVAAVRGTVATLEPSIQFFAPDDPPGDLPSSVVRALNDATAEALRNSLRHANEPGRETTRVVTIVISRPLVTVEIIDDGVGFDIHHVPLERYGIRLSIRHRMSLVAGGSASIESTRGAGTRVLLEWRRPR